MPRTKLDPQRRRNFHVPLPADLYDALRAEAEHAQRPANALARDAIAQWIEAQRSARIDQDVLRYASAVAGTPEDIDLVLEAAALELLENEL
jgi:predicted transcriptional regulator